MTASAGSRVVLMGDPTFFSIRAGANPHTRTTWGQRKRVDRRKAIAQWHVFARLLCQYGVRVLVIPPDPRFPGLVYPANAGFLFPLEATVPLAQKSFYLANLLPARAGEQPIYQHFLECCGFRPRQLQARFEGEADFFPVGDRYLFTYGRVEIQRFRFRLGMPPYTRIYGFRSERGVLPELQDLAPDLEIVPLELCNEAYYHGDTALCAFGPERRFLLAYLDALQPEAAERLTAFYGENLIRLGAADAALYAANSFALAQRDRFWLFMPSGVSDALQTDIRARGVEPVSVEVSEFLRKGGGAVKCMLGDLGPYDETGLSPEQRAFWTARDYRTLFPRGESPL